MFINGKKSTLEQQKKFWDKLKNLKLKCKGCSSYILKGPRRCKEIKEEYYVPEYITNCPCRKCIAKIMCRPQYRRTHFTPNPLCKTYAKYCDRIFSRIHRNTMRQLQEERREREERKRIKENNIPVRTVDFTNVKNENLKVDITNWFYEKLEKRISEMGESVINNNVDFLLPTEKYRAIKHGTLFKNIEEVRTIRDKVVSELNL